MKILTFLSPYLKKYKNILCIFLISNTLLWLFTTATPYLSGLYLDVLLTKKSIHYVLIFTGILLGLNLLNILAEYLMSIYVTKLDNNVIFEINYDIFERFRFFEILSFEKNNTAYLMDKINQDVGIMVTFFSDKVMTIITNFLTIIVSMVILFRIDKQIMLFEIIVIPIYILLYRMFRNKLYDTNYQVAENTSVYFAKRTEQITHMSFIKTNVLFQEMNEELKKSFYVLYRWIMKQVKVNYVFNNLSSILLAFSYVVIIFWGGMKVVNGQLTIGNYTIINSYFSLIMTAVNYYLVLASSYQRALVSEQRIHELMNSEKEPNGSKTLNKIEQIEFKNLHVSYDEKRILIDNLNLILEKGKVYCIKGGNGAGKSTLLNIMLGLYHKIYQGGIYYNAQSISELDMYDVRRKLIAVVEQEPALLNMSIMNYLTIGIDNQNEKELEEQIYQLSKKLEIYDTIQKLPEKFQTSIEQGASNLSGGEKQKLAIIRALIKKSDLLIFDEPTSALDIHSIEVFGEILKEVKKNKIVIMITHDKRIFDLSDQDIELLQ